MEPAANPGSINLDAVTIIAALSPDLDLANLRSRAGDRKLDSHPLVLY